MWSYGIILFVLLFFCSYYEIEIVSGWDREGIRRRVGIQIDERKKKDKLQLKGRGTTQAIQARLFLDCSGHIVSYKVELV